MYGRSNVDVHKQCVRNMQEYYKRSLNYVNKFVNVGGVYQQRAEFKALYAMAIR